MKINILNVIISLLISFSGISQSGTQVFPQAGFKVNCSCKLQVNNLFIEAAKRNNINNIFAAYFCGENPDDAAIGVINNINISDLSSDYAKINPSFHSYFEKKSLEAYANNLQKAGIGYNYTTFQGISALEYSFDQMSLLTKALFFIKNKKTYLIQTGTRRNLQQKFNLLVTTFHIL
jgi:hypothetical protein